MTERGLPSTDGAPACPFVAFGDDREGRSTSPDHRHRCFAESPPAPRAVAHQEAYCLSSAFPVCPTFQDWARREAAHARGTGDRAETAPTAAPMAPMAAMGAMGGGAVGGDRDDRAGAGHDDRDDEDADPRQAGRAGASDEDRGPRDPADLPVRRNPPRDWAAPPPWASGGTGQGSSRSVDHGGSDLLAGRSVEGRGLAGSAADRLAGGPPPASGASAGSSGTAGAGAGAAGAGAALGAAAGAASAWSASAAGSASAAPDDELAGLVQGRPSSSSSVPPTRPEADERSMPVRTGRRPSVSSTRPPGPEIPGPSWERMKRYEAYPAIKSRSMPGMPGLSRVALLAGAVAIAAIALFMLPAFLGVGGGGTSPSASPTGSAPVVAASASPTIAPAPTAQVYIIKSKDTLSKVAKMFGITLEELLAANPEITNPDKISLGQQIVIPVAGAGSGASAPPGSAAP